MFKTRLDAAGAVIETEKVEQLNLAKQVENKTEVLCGSCYGAETPQRKCCNSCDDVLSAYRHNGWGVDNPGKFEQCKNGNAFFSIFLNLKKNNLGPLFTDSNKLQHASVAAL